MLHKAIEGRGAILLVGIALGSSMLCVWSESASEESETFTLSTGSIVGVDVAALSARVLVVRLHECAAEIDCTVIPG
jgi:hypothetical protein